MGRRSFETSRRITNRGIVAKTSSANAQYQNRHSPTVGRTGFQANKVEADIFIDGVWDDQKGMSVAGTHAECTKCGHVTKSFGVKEGSAKRCLVLLKEECPKGERNFYVEKEKEFQCKACGKSFPYTQWLGKDYNLCPNCNADNIPF